MSAGFGWGLGGLWGICIQMLITELTAVLAADKLVRSKVAYLIIEGPDF